MNAKNQQEPLDTFLRRRFEDAGFRTAFEVLWTHHQKLLCRISLGRGLSEDGTRDLLQDVSIKLFGYLSRHVVEAFPGSAVKITKDEICEFYRRAYRLPELNSLEDLLTQNVEPEAPAEDKHVERWSAVQKHMQDLDISSDQQTVVVLHHLIGYSLKEVALITECKPETVKSRLRYASIKMGQSLKKGVS